MVLKFEVFDHKPNKKVLIRFFVHEQLLRKVRQIYYLESYLVVTSYLFEIHNNCYHILLAQRHT